MSDDDLIRRGDAEILLQMFVPASSYQKAISNLAQVPRMNRDLTEGEEISIHLAMNRIPAVTPALDDAAEEYCPSMDPNDCGDCIYCGRSAGDHIDGKCRRTPTPADRLAEALRLPEVAALMEAARDANQSLVDAAEEIAELRLTLGKTDLELPWLSGSIVKSSTALRALTGEGK